MNKPRIKICGFTRREDIEAAVEAGADAVGFVFYPPSPRYIAPERAAELALVVPPFVQVVALFVNADADVVRRTLESVPVNLLQFHGDEDEAYCRQFARPYLKAARVRPGFDLAAYAAAYPSARAMLLDAFVEGYGGAGKVFDWTLIPPGLERPIVLSGGLDAANVGEAIRRVRPAAVDVSSGVETAPGIKSAEKMRDFVAAVRAVGLLPTD